jgi:hypothetical protein
MLLRTIHLTALSIDTVMAWYLHLRNQKTLDLPTGMANHAQLG